jgi:uncharacterized protein YjiS (DUF1127 family)
MSAITLTAAQRPGNGHRLAGLLSRLRRHTEIVVSRRHLARLDDRMLKDLGLSRSQAIYEASRQPWDIGRLP